MQLFQVTDASGVISPGVVRGGDAVIALSDHTEIDSTLELLLAVERDGLDIAAWFDEAVGDGAVWVAYGDRVALRGNYRLARIDPETDTVAATVDLGRHPPTALLLAGDDVWVIAGDGTAQLVTTSDD